MQAIQQPLTLFLIGVTGDLAKKKILKAIYSLYTQGLLPSVFTLVGNSRQEMSREAFQAYVKEIVGEGEKWAQFAQCLQYVSGDVSEPAAFTKLAEFHGRMEKCGNHLWYLATLPKLYIQIVKNLEASGLHHTQCGWTKIMLEKPFGTDLSSARELNSALTAVFSEEQIYRIDHFLAKETVQNILAFRFANGLFENLWRKEFIDHIQITAGETLGITGREIFYDQTGTVRDVIQNHLLQMMAVILMDEPASLAAVDIRDKRRELLTQLVPFTAETVAQHVEFGQYEAGEVDGQKVAGYQQEKGVAADTRTETAVALRCIVDNDRWRGVPIYLRAGKRLARSVTEISIQFKEPSNQMFAKMGEKQGGNVLTLRIQPNEGVVVRLKVKEPGLALKLQEVPMQFCYKNEFQMDLVEAYVKLIYDAVMDDPTLFPHAESIEAAWQFVQPLLEYKNTSAYRPEPYVAGSWGPASFDKLLLQDGRSWIEPSVDVCQI
jgi:glucose-6-phosphate 1-dehydrogenase